MDNLQGLEEVSTLSPDAVVIVDLKINHISFTNPAAITLLDLKVGDPLSKLEALLTSVATEDKDYVRNKYLIIPHQPATINIEFRLLQSGNTIWLSGNVFVFGNKRFVFVILHDITLSRQHENYLVEYTSKKNTLLDTLAHQLNGALSLMNNLAVKAGELNVNKDQVAMSTFISLVQENSNHCIRIIQDLLVEEYSDSPSIAAKFLRIDVVKLVNYIFQELEKTLPTRNFQFDTTSPEIFINTDDFKLLQVINNLASNAVKFTRQSDEIRFLIRETETGVLISVADKGIGIPATLQPFLFEKTGPGRTGLNGEKSIGLGLSICKNIVNLLGGRIWIDTTEDKGTTVFVELPKEAAN